MNNIKPKRGGSRPGSRKKSSINDLKWNPGGSGKEVARIYFEDSGDTKAANDSVHIEVKKRGGSRPGSGAPKKPPGEKRIKTAISMRPDLYEATKGDRSAIIEEALDLLIQKDDAINFDSDEMKLHYDGVYYRWLPK